MLAAACQMFLGKTEAEIAHIALETLEGHQRAIMAHMTVEVGLGGCQAEWHLRTSLSVTDDESDLLLLLLTILSRRSIRTDRNSQSKFSKWPPQT